MYTCCDGVADGKDSAGLVLQLSAGPLNSSAQWFGALLTLTGLSTPLVEAAAVIAAVTAAKAVGTTAAAS